MPSLNSSISFFMGRSDPTAAHINNQLAGLSNTVRKAQEKANELIGADDARRKWLKDTGNKCRKVISDFDSACETIASAEERTVKTRSLLETKIAEWNRLFRERRSRLPMMKQESAFAALIAAWINSERGWGLIDILRDEHHLELHRSQHGGEMIQHTIEVVAVHRPLVRQEDQVSFSNVSHISETQYETHDDDLPEAGNNQEAERDRRHQEEIASKDAELRSLNTSLEEKDNAIAQLNDDVASKEAELQRQKSTLDKTTETIEQLNNNIASKEAELQRLQSTLDNTTKTIEQLNNNIASNDADLEKLRTSLKQKDNTIAQLNDDVASKEAELKVLRTNLKDKDNTIVLLNKGVSSKDSALKVMRTASDNRIKTIDQLTNDVASKDADLAKLRASLQKKKDKIVRLDNSHKRTVACKDAVLKSLRTQLKKKEETIAQLKNNHKQTLASLASKEQNLRTQLEKKEETIAQLKNNHEQTLASKETDLQGVRTNLDEKKGKLVRLNMKNVRLRKKVVQLKRQVETLQKESLELSPTQYELFQGKTDVALRLFVSAMRDDEDDFYKFPDQDKLIPALNNHNTAHTNADPVAHWTVLTTSEPAPADSKVLGDVELLREMLNLFKLMDRPVESLNVGRLSASLQKMTRQVATGTWIYHEVAGYVCQKAHTVIAAIQDMAGFHGDVDMIGVQLCQLLSIMERRWEIIKVPLANVRTFQSRDDAVGRLCKAVCEGDIASVCRGYADRSPWLLRGRNALMTEGNWAHIAYIDMDARVVRILGSDCYDDGRTYTAILYLPGVEEGSHKELEVDLEDVEGRVWWLRNISGKKRKFGASR